MSGSLEHLQVLLVDDNEYMRGVMRTILFALGIKLISEASDGTEAIATLNKTPIDMVFADWLMQPMSGAEFVRFVRTSDASPNPFVPIVLVSSHTEASVIKAARDIGITEILAKPVTAKAVYERIVSIIQNPRPFVRAKSYFGPDRRRKAKDFGGSDKRSEEALEEKPRRGVRTAKKA